MSGERHGVVMMSSGAASWAAGRRWIDLHGPRSVTLVFCDVKGSNPSEHAGEDVDNYRFLREAAWDLGAPLVWLNESRDIWQVYEDEHMLGNNRVPICSKRLKQEPARAFMEAHYDPATTTILLGLDWTEQHRHPGNAAGWAPYPVEYPLMAEPWVEKQQILDDLHARGVRPPRLYDFGFGHANCGGFCCQMGQADAIRLYRTFPERYAYHEAREEAFRAKRGDYAFMADKALGRILAKQGLTQADIERDGKWWKVTATGEALPKRIPLPMRVLRERVEADATLFDATDSGACSCFPFADPPERAA